MDSQEAIKPMSSINHNIDLITVLRVHRGSRSGPGRGLTGSSASKNTVCPTHLPLSELHRPPHEDTDRLFHQLTLDPAYDERPERALAAWAENSTAPISPPLPPFRTILSERMSLDAELGPCHVLLMGNHVFPPKKKKKKKTKVRENWLQSQWEMCELCLQAG